MSHVPAGEWRVTVEGDGLPMKYTDENTTGLIVTVKGGNQTFDLKLN